jgi:hypothetical protein
MDDNTLTIIMLLVVGALILVLPSIRNKRAANSLIKRFRDQQALDEKSARTPAQLGVSLTSAAPNSLLGVGDPTQSAMTALREANVIILTDDGKMYLSEANLARSKFNQVKN